MKFHKGRGDGNSLMQVAAAVVGSAAAAQHIPTGSPPCCDDHELDGVETIQCCHDCPAAEAAGPSVSEMERLRARVAELEQAAPVAALDVHAALNTYEVVAGTPAGFEQTAPHMARLVGANRRKLIARWDADGLWLGGCLIADREHAEALASFITREAEDG